MPQQKQVSRFAQPPAGRKAGQLAGAGEGEDREASLVFCPTLAVFFGGVVTSPDPGRLPPPRGEAPDGGKPPRNPAPRILSTQTAQIGRAASRRRAGPRGGSGGGNNNNYYYY